MGWGEITSDVYINRQGLQISTEKEEKKTLQITNMDILSSSS